MSTVTIHVGDCLHTLRAMPDASVQCCVTSPPYWGLRDYGHDGQIGLESTPEAYVSRMMEVFREVRRVLRDNGTLWLNLGDSYAASTSNNGGYSDKSTLAGFSNPNTKGRQANESGERRRIDHGVKPKDLIGIPWRVAFALQADGWYLRQDIIWHKPNPMPESVRDRCTKAHEYVFLLSKGQRYYYDADAVAEPATAGTHITTEKSFGGQAAGAKVVPSGNQIPGKQWSWGNTRNRRSVWTITTKPYSGAHFAVMPPDLADPCIRAGCPEGGVVLDPFGGAGTVGLMANRLGRDAVLCELNPEYAELARRRIADDNRLFGKVIVRKS